VPLVDLERRILRRLADGCTLARSPFMPKTYELRTPNGGLCRQVPAAMVLALFSAGFLDVANNITEDGRRVIGLDPLRPE
jgi:hypothetical protein